MKNVLLLLPGAFSGVGGIEMYNRQLVRAFLELGAERHFGVRTLVLNDLTADVDDRYVPRGASVPKGFSRRTGRFVSSALWSVLRESPELVLFGHVHFSRLAPLVRLLSPRSRHWHLVHGIEVWRPLSVPIRRGLGLAERILSVSDYSRRELVRNAGIPLDDVGLLPCALDPVWQTQYAPQPSDTARPERRTPRLLTVARLSSADRYKGVDSVLQALPEVLLQVPGAVYEVVGDGDDRPRLEALARSLGVSGHVVFRGRLWPDELAAAYEACSLFAMPSSHEGFGIVFLEAALFGKPSVGGRQGGTPEVIEDGVTGALVDREDVPGVARVLTRMLSDHDERARMGEAARRRLHERFTYGSFRVNLAAHLEGLAKEARRAAR